MAQSRAVRVHPLFFECLDELLPGTRGVDGTPSASDFLRIDLPPILDALAADFEAVTSPDPGLSTLRVYATWGVVTGPMAVYSEIADDGAIEVVLLVLGDY